MRGPFSVNEPSSPPYRLKREAGTFLWPMRCQRPHILNMRPRTELEHICRGRAGTSGRRLHLFISIHLPTFASYLPGSLTTFEAHFGACSPLTVFTHCLWSSSGKICPGNSGTHLLTCLSGANVTLTDRFGGCPHIEGRGGPVLDPFRVQVGRFVLQAAAG